MTASKKPRLSKADRSRKATPQKRRRDNTPLEKAKARGLKTATIGKWMAMVKRRASAAAAANEPSGACLLPNPAGGPRMCVQVDEATCKTLKGRFVGGPC